MELCFPFSALEIPPYFTMGLLWPEKLFWNVLSIIILPLQVGYLYTEHVHHPLTFTGLYFLAREVIFSPLLGANFGILKKMVLELLRSSVRFVTH